MIMAVQCKWLRTYTRHNIMARFHMKWLLISSLYRGEPESDIEVDKSGRGCTRTDCPSYSTAVKGQQIIFTHYTCMHLTNMLVLADSHVTCICRYYFHDLNSDHSHSENFHTFGKVCLPNRWANMRQKLKTNVGHHMIYYHWTFLVSELSQIYCLKR